MTKYNTSTVHAEPIVFSNEEDKGWSKEQTRVDIKEIVTLHGVTSNITCLVKIYYS